ncbi:MULTISPECIES: hypothetical protein [Streptomyces]|nr:MULTISPECIES: hypothetical protein [Streptomyces]WMD05553.1 hypothetical protein Q7C01_14640 [Streptomyces sp. FXY-T5]
MWNASSPRPRAFERHFHRPDGDALIFTTITKGRAGRRLNDGNWR